MAEENKTLPMSSAGIMVSTEEAEVGIKLKPEHVAIAITVVIIIELLLPLIPK